MYWPTKLWFGSTHVLFSRTPCLLFNKIFVRRNLLIFIVFVMIVLLLVWVGFFLSTSLSLLIDDYELVNPKRKVMM